MRNLKVGQKIRAVSTCGGSLIVGKEYPIKEVLKDRIIIKDEISDIHNFTFEYFNKYFELVDEIPELVGVEMEVSDNKIYWDRAIVYGTNKEGCFVTSVGIYPFARPIQENTLELTIEEIAEKLGVDKVIIKKLTK